MDEQWEETFDTIVVIVSNLIFGVDGSSKILQGIVKAALQKYKLDEHLQQVIKGN